MSESIKFLLLNLTIIVLVVVVVDLKRRVSVCEKEIKRLEKLKRGL